MGTLKLTATSPAQSAFTELLTVEDVTAFLQLPPRIPPDDAETALIEQFIIGARQQAELAQEGRDLVAKQWDLTLDSFPCMVMLRGPVASVDLVRYRDSDGTYTTLVEDTDFYVDYDRSIIQPLYQDAWPTFDAWPTSAVLVRYTVAPDVDNLDLASIKVGMKYLISQWFNNRLPFETGRDPIQEYPFTISRLLSSGAVPKVRMV